MTNAEIETVLGCGPVIIEAGSEPARKRLRVLLALAYAELCRRKGPDPERLRHQVADLLLLAIVQARPARRAK